MDKSGYGLVSPSAYKQGHKCCGGCCDVRRASIIVNIVNIIISLLFMLEFIFIDKIVAKDEEVINDEEQLNNLHTAAAIIKKLEGLLVFFLMIKIACSAVGIHGAYTFSVPKVGVALGCYTVFLIFDVLTLSFGGILMDAFFAYPHIYLIMEMNEGIMSPENYINEEQSCCCV
eukprot:CAMPEP_0194048406 /NCGR_PEP_ID=MMETSP0009_2-20130614/27196_1 /TAXON_ID=210454 /ORGANISM="Grammatophora oceanica, Strain CCMP 410" /LENGTH=172 /DNA_ID=CAMNT_0038694259 /DNA_START=51 /DNA_END=569 /DNA_ORIENTATION=-